jgi:uncharacterized membrane protein
MRYYPNEPFYRPAGAGLLFLFLVALMIALAVVLFLALRKSRERQVDRTVPTPAPAPVAGDQAIHTARMRYARGELSRDEFNAIMSDLRADYPGTV